MEIDCDEAHAETYHLFAGTEREPANHMTISGGRYVDRPERRDGRWAIVDRVCVVEFLSESQSLLTGQAIALVPRGGADSALTARGPRLTKYLLRRKVRLGRSRSREVEERGFLIPGGSGAVPH